MSTLLSLKKLLTQAATSRDRDLLEKAFSVTDQEIIASSIRKLPQAQVLPLLEELVDRLIRKPMRAIKLAFWIQTLFLIHGEYLQTIPDLKARLRPLKMVAEERARNLQLLVQVKGQVESIIASVQEKANQVPLLDPQEAQEAVTNPLVVYDESDEEGDFSLLPADPGDSFLMEEEESEEEEEEEEYDDEEDDNDDGEEDDDDELDEDDFSEE